MQKSDDHAFRLLSFGWKKALFVAMPAASALARHARKGRYGKTVFNTGGSYVQWYSVRKASSGIGFNICHVQRISSRQSSFRALCHDGIRMHEAPRRRGRRRYRGKTSFFAYPSISSVRVETGVMKIILFSLRYFRASSFRPERAFAESGEKAAPAWKSIEIRQRCNQLIRCNRGGASWYAFPGRAWERGPPPKSAITTLFCRKKSAGFYSARSITGPGSGA